jgi:hypothetical protein
MSNQQVATMGVFIFLVLLSYAVFLFGYQWGYADAFNQNQPRTADQLCAEKYMGKVIFTSQGRYCMQPDNYSWRLGDW